MNNAHYDTSLSKSFNRSQRNRELLLQFLWQCERLLHRDGLVFITSKDVKPYAQWRLEDRLTEFCSELQYFGKLPFQASDFPGYNCQNVGRDSMVKDTMAMTYIYGFKGSNGCTAFFDELLRVCFTRRKASLHVVFHSPKIIACVHVFARGFSLGAATGGFEES